MTRKARRRVRTGVCHCVLSVLSGEGVDVLGTRGKHLAQEVEHWSSMCQFLIICWTQSQLN